jgi:hypothetical protein
MGITGSPFIERFRTSAFVINLFARCHQLGFGLPCLHKEKIAECGKIVVVTDSHLGCPLES